VKKFVGVISTNRTASASVTGPGAFVQHYFPEKLPGKTPLGCGMCGVTTDSLIFEPEELEPDEDLRL